MSNFSFTPVKKSAIDRAIAKALFSLKEQALTDCNKYAKWDTVILKSSSYAVSRGDEIELVWNTPYAKYAYYTGRPSHKDTYIQWCEKAKIEFYDDWLEILNKGMSDNL